MTLFRKIRLLFFFLAIVGVGGDCFAQSPAASPVTLIREVDAEFQPDRIFFLVAQEGTSDLQRMPGIFEPISQNESGIGKYLVATSVDGGNVSSSPTFAVVLVGKEDQLSYFPPLERKESESTIERLWDVQRVREELAAVRLEIAQEQKRQGDLNQKIQVLKRDATVIARLERVDSLKARMEQLQLRIEGIDNDISHLKEFLELTRKQSQPRNYARRERELVRQLKLLADASQAAETSEEERRSQAYTAMREQLRLIESSRGVNEQSLKNQLATLRQRRLALQRKRRGDMGSMELPEEYLQ